MRLQEEVSAGLTTFLRKIEAKDAMFPSLESLDVAAERRLGETRFLLVHTGACTINRPLITMHD